MPSKYWILLTLSLGVPALAAGGNGPARVTLGIASPMGQLGQSPELAESMRQGLVGQLRAQSIDAVALAAPGGALLQAEAQAKHCNYVLYIRLDRKHGRSGFFGKLSALTPSGKQQAISAANDPAPAGIQQGDTVTLDFRLLPTGSTDPIRAETFAGKVDSDGQDVVGPLVTQLAGSVAAAIGGAAGTDRQASAATAASASSPTAGTDSPSPKPHTSFFGGLLGHNRRPDSGSNSMAGAGAGPMDCARLTSMPGAMMTLQSCQQMQSAQLAADRAAADPGAAHPGDDQMTCAQITAELSEQPFKTPDQSQRTAAQATAARLETNRKQEFDTMMKEKAESQAAVSAASAADSAVEVASLGMVRGRALQATEKAVDARNRATNERLDKENQKVAQQAFGQMGDLSSDMGKQFQANPRLARLMQLANTKHCKWSGS